MKKIIFFPLLLLMFFSCKKESASISGNVPAAEESLYQPLSALHFERRVFDGFFLTCGNWGINYYSKNGTNVSTEYTPLKFRFCPNNTVELSNDILSFNGNYYFTLDKGNPNYLEIVIDFRHTTAAAYWTSVQGVWKIRSLEPELIQLSKDSDPYYNESLLLYKLKN